MTNNEIPAERIKELRELCEVKERHVCNDIGGCTMTYGSPACKGCHENITVKEREITEEDAVEALLCTLDALEASMRREAEKDATIIRLTAERDAAVCDMFGCMSTQGQCVRCKKRYYCDGTDDDKFSPLCKNNSHCYAWEWRGLHADNTDAPTGAENS